MTSRFSSVSKDLQDLIENWEDKLKSLSGENIFLHKNSQGRNIKQIAGHMADSATNNTHRVIHLQYQESPISYPDYANLGNNDRWISIQNYQEKDWKQLVDLWSATNRHFAWIIDQLDENSLGAVWTSALQEEISLESMIMDFPRHFKLHLDEIEDLINRN